MNLNNANKLLDVFNSNKNEIQISQDIIAKAKRPIDRMVNFQANNIINKAS